MEAESELNVFYVHKNPAVAAQSLCDKHVVKMIVETAQLLSAAHHLCAGVEPDRVYKLSHRNHPSSVWARTDWPNYRWLYLHFTALCDEYTHRYGRVHATDSKLRHVLQVIPSMGIGGFTPPPQCMPDEFKQADTVSAYRAYYVSKQNQFKIKWTNRSVPEWFQKEIYEHELGTRHP